VRSYASKLIFIDIIFDIEQLYMRYIVPRVFQSDIGMTSILKVDEQDKYMVKEKLMKVIKKRTAACLKMLSLYVGTTRLVDEWRR
jgi:hypothetical protein